MREVPRLQDQCLFETPVLEHGQPVCGFVRAEGARGVAIVRAISLLPFTVPHTGAGARRSGVAVRFQVDRLADFREQQAPLAPEPAVGFGERPRRRDGAHGPCIAAQSVVTVRQFLPVLTVASFASK